MILFLYGNHCFVAGASRIGHGSGFVPLGLHLDGASLEVIFTVGFSVCGCSRTFVMIEGLGAQPFSEQLQGFSLASTTPSNGAAST